MTLVSRAVVFAANAHEGMTRKGTQIPYIVHPMEVAAIAASLTDDSEVIAACLLHDVIEDCGVTQEQLCEQFGPRVAFLVAHESQVQAGDPRETWDARKQAAVDRIASGCRDAQIIALSDKLSNMRAIARDYARDGDAMFFRFHQHDKRRHAWYYRSCAALLGERFGDTEAWQELCEWVEYVFAGIPKEEFERDDAEACAG